MNREDVDKNSEGTPQKQKTKWTWKDRMMLGSILLLSILVVIMFLRGAEPLKTVSLAGTVVIFNENGEILPSPHPQTYLTFYSHYPPSFFNSDSRHLNKDNRREQRFFVDDSGKFGIESNWGKPILIPNYDATLFFHTRNGKYATVVDIAKGEPTTELAVELRPRLSATGRLIHRDNGTPLAHYELELNFFRFFDAGSDFPFGQRYSSWKDFQKEYCVTDADGFFTVDHLIPGVKYTLYILLPNYPNHFTHVKIPILQQYQQPYHFGDVPVWVELPEDSPHRDTKDIKE